MKLWTRLGTLTQFHMKCYTQLRKKKKAIVGIPVFVVNIFNNIYIYFLLSSFFFRLSSFFFRLSSFFFLLSSFFFRLSSFSYDTENVKPTPFSPPKRKKSFVCSLSSSPFFHHSVWFNSVFPSTGEKIKWKKKLKTPVFPYLGFILLSVQSSRLPCLRLNFASSDAFSMHATVLIHMTERKIELLLGIGMDALKCRPGSAVLIGKSFLLRSFLLTHMNPAFPEQKVTPKKQYSLSASFLLPSFFFASNLLLFSARLK